MKLTKCPNGHFYDADKHPECPYCNGGLEAGSAIAQPGTAAEVDLAAPKGPVAGWLVVLDGPARGQDLRLGEGRNFLGVDAAGNPAALDANSPLAVRRGIVVYDPQDNNWCALPGMKPLPPFQVIYQTAEDGLGDTVKPRLIEAAADLDRVLVIDEAKRRLPYLTRA